MQAPRSAGGAALKPTTYTYTAAMRAALGANLLERALQVRCHLFQIPALINCLLSPVYRTSQVRGGVRTRCRNLFKRDPTLRYDLVVEWQQ